MGIWILQAKLESLGTELSAFGVTIETLNSPACLASFGYGLNLNFTQLLFVLRFCLINFALNIFIDVARESLDFISARLECIFALAIS